MIVTRRRHRRELAAANLAAHKADLRTVRAYEIRERTRAALDAELLRLVDVWLRVRAAGYLADADATPTKPKSPEFTDAQRRAIAHELENIARDFASMGLR